MKDRRIAGCLPWRAATLFFTAIWLASCAAQQQQATGDRLLLSVFGTNDVHGQLLPAANRGGLVSISAYVDALRAARREDGGGLLVIDAGDMWQGTLESNLVEGAAVVEAYNAIGYDAAAIGNHEFDFGPVGKKAIPENSGDDPRGALKRRIAEAAFPVLAANLIDEETGRPVEWDNVQPSILVNVAGVNVGVVGVVTERALQTTISANTRGLRIAPLVETIREEALQLRDRGATIVIVSAHAGSSCTEFEDPGDLSSCNMSGEIMRVAARLPAGLVDHVIAGHVHEGISHVVNGISITSSFSSTRAFSRVDFEVDRGTGKLISRTLFPPQMACINVVLSTGACATLQDDPDLVRRAVYEGRQVIPNSEVVEIAEHAAAFARQIKEEKLGVYLESAFLHPPSTESALANLVTDALRQSTGADIALHNVIGGIRNILPAGELTYGAVYEMSPFDNRIVELDLSGAELRQVVAQQAKNPGRRAGFSGMRVSVRCADTGMHIEMRLDNGLLIRDGDRVRVIANDYLASGGDGILTPILPDGGFAVDDSQALTRETIVEWFKAHTGKLRPADFQSTENPRWNFPEGFSGRCDIPSTNTSAAMIQL